MTTTTEHDLADDLDFEEAAPATDLPSEHAVDASMLTRLKAKRERIREERRLFLDVPGYGGEIVAEYRPLSWDTLNKIGTKAEKSKSDRKALMAHADTIATACVELHVQKPGDPSTRIPIGRMLEAGNAGFTWDGEPIRFDHQLARGFEFKATSARQAVFDLFNDEVAVTTHHNELAEWMQDTDVNDDEAFEGESSSTRS